MNKIIKILLYLVALTPLLMDKLVFYPYTSLKSLIFRSIIILISFLFIGGFIFIDKFRESINQKIKIISNNKLFISILSFIVIVGVSTIFAVDKYTAFWGGLERAEGFSSFVYYFIFLSLMILFFEKKDWLVFFKLNILTSLIVLSYESIEFFGGAGRPGSFFGNPTFLAGYLIFSIIFAIIVISENKNKFWKYLSIFSIIFSVFGIFMAETRGTILGLFIGLVVSLIYGIVKGKEINYKKINLRKISIIILSVIIAFSAIFIATRKSEFWQKIPGLSRVALISLEDSSTSTRLLTQKISLKSINLSNNGLKVLFIGYGQDNFGYAYGKYFDPIQFEDEMKWFDRSHNKFLDVLVMNGAVGLISYLSIFILLFIFIFKRKEFSLTSLGILFGIVAYLVHLFFVFDQVTTYIPLFIIIAFVIYNYQIDFFNKNNHNRKSIYATIFLFIFILSSIFIYFRNDVIAYFQMRKFSSLLKQGNATVILKNIDYSLYPFTNAQVEIRRKMFSITEKNFDKEKKNIVSLARLSLSKGEEYASYNNFDFVFKINLANDFTSKGKKLLDVDLLKKGEAYFKEVMSFTPNRPDANYGLAINLYYQKRYGESFGYFEKSFDLSQKYFLRRKDEISPIYPIFLKYFLENKDLENLKKVSNRLDSMSYESAPMVLKLIEYIERTNTWPPVRFNSN